MTATELQAALAYDKIASEAGLAPAYRADVYKLADLEKAGGDDSAVRAKLAEWLDANPRFATGAKAAGRPQDGPAKVVVTRAQLRDVAWTTANRKLLADPSKYELEPPEGGPAPRAEEVATPRPDPPRKLPRGEGAGRGGESPGFGGYGDGSRTLVTRDQLRDHNWTRANRELLKDPSRLEVEPNR